MVNISLIAAVDERFGLGCNNQLLCHLPADLKHFKQLTLGKSIIMGRNTFLSIGKPLPGRQNIVLSRASHQISGVEMADSLAAGIALANHRDEIMIIGGANLFYQAITLANRIYLTLIHHQFPADVFFPALDEKEWYCQGTETRPCDQANPFDLTFYDYCRVNKNI